MAMFTGWWLGHPSEKYESQWWHSQYSWENKIDGNQFPPTSMFTRGSLTAAGQLSRDPDVRRAPGIDWRIVRRCQTWFRSAALLGELWRRRLDWFKGKSTGNQWKPCCFTIEYGGFRVNFPRNQSNLGQKMKIGGESWPKAVQILVEPGCPKMSKGDAGKPSKLVGGWVGPPLWKMMDFVNWDDYSQPNISGKMPNWWQPVPTNQKVVKHLPTAMRIQRKW